MIINQPVAETRTEHISFVNGIMHCITKKVEYHGIEDAKENVFVANDLASNESYRLLIDLRNSKHASIEARKYYTSDKNNKALAAAFVIKSPVSLILGKMFMGLNKPSFPVSLFNSESEAIEWLNNLQLSN